MLLHFLHLTVISCLLVDISAFQSFLRTPNLITSLRVAEINNEVAEAEDMKSWFLDPFDQSFQKVSV